MNISITGTNVIVLYGDRAAARYSDLINRWSGMIPTTQWESFQFILAASEMPRPELKEEAAALVSNNNTRFYRMDEPALDSASYHDLIFDKIRAGNVHLHIVADADEGELPLDWLKAFVQAATQIQALTTGCLYYLLFGRNSDPAVREELVSLLETCPGTAFFAGDTQENGGRVLQEDRWHAVELAMLANSTEKIPLYASAYSFGYSALNANGSELRILRESAACRALREELNRSIQSMPESDSYLRLLPEGADSLSALRSWLEAKVAQETRPPAAEAWRNAWITIRMGPDLPAPKAMERMKRFADLNYAANEDILRSAKALALQVEEQVRGELCSSVATACLSPQLLTEIADAFHQMVETDAEPMGAAYPPKPKLAFLGRKMEEYAEGCRNAVRTRIIEYIRNRNRSAYAEEMEKAYRRLAVWIRDLQEDQTVGSHRITAQELLQEKQRELDGSDDGNALRLSQKYKTYWEALMGIHPNLLTMTEGIHGVYYRDSGELCESGWTDLVSRTAQNLEKKLPGSFKGDFFKVLGSEFDTAEERKKFFSEYLQNGPRMYRNLSSEQSSGITVMLADNHLMEQWPVSGEIYEVHTDNAENLTYYPLGSLQPTEYLKDTSVYFRGNTVRHASSGADIFGDSLHGRPQRQGQRRYMDSGQNFFGSSGAASAEGFSPEERQRVRLVPDDKNEYRLYWPWNQSDATAMVQLLQSGTQIGRVAVITVAKYQENGSNMNVSEDILGGKPLPMGNLTVNIRGSDGQTFVEGARVPGKREVVRYKLSGGKLQLKPEHQDIVKRLTLKDIRPDGSRRDYPLYQADNERPWFYEGLSLNDGTIATDRAPDGDRIYPVRVD